ncbi:MAG: PQQ-binding-like beta-propeller repeat protein [Hyphomonadaceae bacterium]
MNSIRPYAALAAAALLSACGTVGRAADAVWPFSGGSSNTQTAPEEGRISILTFEQRLTPDPQLAARPIVVAAPNVGEDWSQPGGNAHNAPINVQGAGNLTVERRFSLGAGSNDRVRLAAPPIILNGSLYFLDADHHVRAFDASSGSERWNTRLRPEESRDRVALGGGITSGDGRIYATTGFGFAVALDAQTGAEIWRTRVNAPFHTAPTFAGGRVFAVTNDSELVAMDAATGAVQWTHQAIAEPARIRSSSSPAVAGDTVIAPFASGEIIGLLAANGRRLWVDALTRAGRLTSLSAINDIAGRPVIDNGVIYAASHSGVLAAIDLRSGQRIWSISFASTQTPWISGDVVYAVTVDGELAALDRTNGSVYWVRQLRRFEEEDERRGRIAWTGPIMAGGRLILANSIGEVAAVNPANGEIVQSADVDQPVFIPPIASNGAIYVVTDDARAVVMR